MTDSAAATPETLDGSYRPRTAPVTATVPVDGDLVVVDAAGNPHALNRTAALLWPFLDGRATVDDLAADVAATFAVDSTAVRADLLELLRHLARLGLLADVAAPPMDVPGVQGLPAGTAVGPLTLPDLDGRRVRVGGGGGRRTLLVHWNPGCGYCGQILDTLGRMRKPLRDAGVDLVLLASGGAAANRTLLAGHAADVPVVLRSADPAAPDPFAGVGTPAAYVLDGDGAVASDLHVGAVEVPALARDLAGISEDSSGVAFLPVPGGACLPGQTDGRRWAPAQAYRVGDVHVGIRCDTEETRRTVTRLLAAQHAPQVRGAPDHYSVVLPPASDGAVRGLALLLQGGGTLVRSRSGRRVLDALVAWLSALLPPPPDCADLPSCRAPAVVADGRAVLLPPAARGWLRTLQPRLARLGVRPVDSPRTFLDPDSAAVVVPAPALPVDAAVLAAAGIPADTRSERRPAAPGRYPLAAWLFGAGDAPLGRAAAAAWASTLLSGTQDRATQVTRLAGLFTAVPAVGLPADEPAALMAALADRLPAG